MKRFCLVLCLLLGAVAGTRAQTAYNPTPRLVTYLVDGVVTPLASTATSGQLGYTPLAFLAKCKNGDLVVDCDFSGGGSGDTITSPNSTLTVGGTATATTLDLNLAHTNIWTAAQSFPSDSIIRDNADQRALLTYTLGGTRTWDWGTFGSNHMVLYSETGGSTGVVVDVATDAGVDSLVVSSTGAAFLRAVTAPLYKTTTTCGAVGTAASPSLVACAAAPAGVFSCSATASTGTCVISSTAVTANSTILVTPTSYANTRLSVTCNTTPVETAASVNRVSAISAGVSFTINVPTITTNPACYSYEIIN